MTQVSDRSSKRFLGVYIVGEEAQHHVYKKYAFDNHGELEVVFPERCEINVDEAALNSKDVHKMLNHSIWHALMINDHGQAEFFRVEHLKVVYFMPVICVA